MARAQTISLEKDFISNLKELNTIEQDQIKIYSAIFTNTCKNCKEEKINSLTESIYNQIKFNGKNPEKYSNMINDIILEYNTLIEKILNLYVTKFISVLNELQTVYNNQKISITNCKLALDAENEVKLSASEYKVDNYEILIQECKNQLMECKNDMENEINSIFYDKRNSLAIKKSNIFQRFFNLFNSNKKIINFVFNPLNNEIQSLQNVVNTKSQAIRSKTLNDISIIEDGLIKTREIFKNMLKEYGYNG